MIMLMGAVIAFGAHELWKDPASPDLYRYAVSIAIAVLVIVLKIQALRKAAAEQ
jgi:RsiW-degrading membrane proteinase PrsW (M82 family)